MLPLPYLLAAAAIACALAFGSGWHYGAKVTKADWAAEKINVAVAQADSDQRIYEADRKNDEQAAEIKRLRAKKQQVIVQQVFVDREIPDPPECFLDARRVSTINRAVGISADSEGKAATLPSPVGTTGRQPQRSGVVGGADSVRVPGLQ